MTQKKCNSATRSLAGRAHFPVLVAAVVALLGATNAAICQDSSAGKSPITAIPATKTVKWNPSVQKAFAEAESKWMVATEAAKSQLNADLRRISQGVDGSALANEVVSWNSKWQMLGGQLAFRNWLDSRFKNLMLDPNDLKLLVRRRLELLHEKLVGIDNELFVAIRADVNKDFTRISLPSIDLTNLERELNVAIGHGEEAAWTSIGEFAASTGVSWITGGAATTFFQGFGEKDANGNTTAATEIAAWLFGGAVGLFIEQVISDGMDVNGHLRAELESAVSSVINQVLLGQSSSSCWVKPIETLKEHHRTECINAISSRLGSR